MSTPKRIQRKRTKGWRIPDEVEAFAWIVRAARCKYAAEHPEPPVGGGAS